MSNVRNIPNRDRDHLLNDARWCQWPLCPVKRYDHKKPGVDGLECGLVLPINGAESKVTVYVHNLFQMQSGPILPQLEGVQKFEYGCVDDMLADRWVVD